MRYSGNGGFRCGFLKEKRVKAGARKEATIGLEQLIHSPLMETTINMRQK